MKVTATTAALLIMACTALAIAEKDVPQLVADLAVQDQGNHTCNTACGILMRMGDDAVPALRDALTNENDRVRYYAVRCLGQINSKAARAALIDAFANGPEDVREHAAYALTWIPDRDAEQVYIAFLSGRDEWHVRHAIKALGDIRSEMALPHLSQLRDNPKGWYSYYAAFVAIRKIEAKEPSPEIQAALDFLRHAKYSPTVYMLRLASSADIIGRNLPSIAPDVFDIFLWVTKGNESQATPNAATIIRDAGPLAYPVVRIGLSDPDENVSRKTKQLVEQLGWKENLKQAGGADGAPAAGAPSAHP